MITPFNFSSLPRTPWKNGGGETREIVSVPSPDADAPFSGEPALPRWSTTDRFPGSAALTGSLP
jgi:hypothetical protein